MKQSSSEIEGFIEGSEFQDLDQVIQIADEEGFVFESNEYELGEAIADLQELLRYLKTSIESNVLDELIYSERQEIIEQLKKIRGELNQIREERNDHVSQLINQIARLKKLLLHDLNLAYKVTDKIDYSQEIQDIKELKQEQNELLVVLDNAEEIASNISEFEEHMDQISTDAQGVLSDVEELRSQMRSEVQEFEGFLETNHNEISNRRDKLENLADETDSMHQQVTEKIDRIEDLEERLSEDVDEADAIRSTLNSLLDRAESLQNDVDDLLSGAISGALGNRFEDRKIELRRSSKFWAGMTILAVTVLIVAAWIIFQDIVGRADLGYTTLSKLALLLPVSVAVWFTARNYGRERKLLEEYAFKTSISLSLDGFREVLEKQISEQDATTIGDFLTTSMAQIYTNPLFNLAKAEKVEESEDVTNIETMKEVWESLRNR